MILVALAALILFSAGAAEGPYPVPRLGWHQWFFLFLSSSFLGCLFEMGVVWLGTGVLMSRSSLLYGAVSVVWGLGALLMLLILYPLRRYGPGTVFAGGMILGGGQRPGPAAGRGYAPLCRRLPPHGGAQPGGEPQQSGGAPAGYLV